MVELFRQGWDLQRESREEIWTIEYEQYESRREFRRARIRAFIRTITRWSMLFSSRAGSPAESGRLYSLPISLIVGVIDVHGRTRHVPMMGRTMSAAWGRLFRETDHDSHFPLLVVAGKNGWYLAGGPGALLALEVARARGARFVPVRTVSVRQLMRCLEPEASDDCLGAA